MKKKYYYLVAGLPELSLKTMAVEKSFAAFIQEIREQVTEKDRHLIDRLVYGNDNRNLIALIINDRSEQKETPTFVEPNTFTARQFRDALEDPEQTEPFPQYLQEFFIENAVIIRKEDQAIIEDKLNECYYRDLLNAPNTFLTAYYEFELNLKNVITGMNCRKFDLEPGRYLIGGNEVREAVEKSSLTDFGLSSNHPWVVELISLFEKAAPIELETGIDDLRWRMIDDINTFEYFTIDAVLGFVIKLLSIERWKGLDPVTGEARYRKLLGNMMGTFELSARYNVRGRSN